MTAHDQMRAMLDQLMGTGRNGESSTYYSSFNHYGYEIPTEIFGT